MTREERGDRGLGWYMDEVDGYGDTRVELSDSSSAEGPHAWLRLASPLKTVNGVAGPVPMGGRCSAHLDSDRVHRLIEALQEWQRHHGVMTEPEASPSTSG